MIITYDYEDTHIA